MENGWILADDWSREGGDILEIQLNKNDENNIQLTIKGKIN